MTAVVAVDLGASSARVCRVDLAARPPALEVVHRQPHQPAPDSAGHLRWDWDGLIAAVETGLATALDGGSVASIGVDTWGVDYGLLDRAGCLVAPPYSYRDHRTDGYDKMVARLGAERLYATTGIQLQQINTVFQLAAHDRAELSRARQLLMLPELLVHHLTGEVLGERSSAGTTGLVDIATGEWSAELAEAVGVDPAILPPLHSAATPSGSWRGIPVHLVGGHDTASAVVAMAPSPHLGAAFVSSGTWLLVGREQDEPDLSQAARQANLTNEAGALGGIRLLRNLAGSWLIEQCRPSWGDAAVDELLAAAAAAGPVAARVDVADPRFLHPADMLGEVTRAAGLAADAPAPTVVRCLVESMAAGSAQVLDQLGGVTEVHVFGGGSRSALYRRCLADLTGLPVTAGPVEATALGNALVQGIALGVYDDLADARSHLEPREEGAP
ncbi:MAG: rhamnulokinase [Acidimicrobiales bacterium]